MLSMILMLVFAPIVALFTMLLQPEYTLPTWFIGLAPTLAFIINAVIFSAYERGTGKEMTAGAKRLILMAFSFAIAVVLPLTGAVSLPAPFPGLEDPVALVAWASLLTGWVFLGATIIYALLEAVKAVTVRRSTWLPG